MMICLYMLHMVPLELPNSMKSMTLSTFHGLNVQPTGPTSPQPADSRSRFQQPLRLQTLRICQKQLWCRGLKLAAHLWIVSRNVAQHVDTEDFAVSMNLYALGSRQPRCPALPKPEKSLDAGPAERL